jgi:ABC-type phosphate/phosphonate transport system substrate-binding protein
MPPPPASRAPRALLIAAVAYDPKVVTLWENLREHLGSQGVPIDYVLYGDYARAGDALVAGHVDGAFLDPVTHVRARNAARILPIAMRDVDRDYQSKILVRRDANITKLGDLAGKTIALGTVDSAHARILPLHFLKQAGAPLEQVAVLAHEHDLGKHGDTPGAEIAVVQALQEGRAHAGAIGAPVYASLLASGRIDPRVVDVLWTTPAFDHHMLDVVPAAEERATGLRRALCDLRWTNARHRRLLEIDGIRGWVAGREDGYTQLAIALGVEDSAGPR